MNNDEKFDLLVSKLRDGKIDWELFEEEAKKLKLKEPQFVILLDLRIEFDPWHDFKLED